MSAWGVHVGCLHAVAIVSSGSVMERRKHWTLHMLNRTDSREGGILVLSSLWSGLGPQVGAGDGEVFGGGACCWWSS